MGKKNVLVPLLLFCLAAVVGLAPFPTLTSPPALPELAQATPPLAIQDSTDVLSSALKGLLIQFLPGTLYDSEPGWSHTTRVPNGVKWPGHGLRRHPEVQYALRNAGTWRKVRLTTDDAAHSLHVALSDLKWDKADRLTFTLAAWIDLRVDFEQQQWQAGVRLYAASAKARVRVKLTLRCEAVLRLEMASALLPDMVVRFRAVGSDVAYDHLVAEHLAGIGGTGARWLGELVRATVHDLRPSVEQNLLGRANAALLRAGDSREVRLGVGSLLSGRTKS